MLTLKKLFCGCIGVSALMVTGYSAQAQALSAKPELNYNLQSHTAPVVANTVPTMTADPATTAPTTAIAAPTPTATAAVTTASASSTSASSAASQPLAATQLLPANTELQHQTADNKVQHYRLTTNGIFPESELEQAKFFHLASLDDQDESDDFSPEDVVTLSSTGDSSTANKLSASSGKAGLKAAPSQFKKGKAYVVNGKRYVPFAEIKQFTQTGTASWYGPGFHGRKAANGEKFSANELTAAHRELPLNSLIRVSHVGTGKSVVVRVTDRGPFHDNRVLDLSYAAAKKLGMIKSGKAKVKIELLNKGKPIL